MGTRTTCPRHRRRSAYEARAGGARAERAAGPYGVLPMFGFPTRVRQLLRAAATSRGGPRALESAAVADRPLDMAVSSFAPGAVVVRDGWVHTAVGFAAYTLQGRLVQHTDPLGPATRLGVCPDCSTTLIEPESDACPRLRRRTPRPRDVPAARVPDVLQQQEYDEDTVDAPTAGAPLLAVSGSGSPPDDSLGAVTLQVLRAGPDRPGQRQLRRRVPPAADGRRQRRRGRPVAVQAADLRGARSGWGRHR